MWGGFPAGQPSWAPAATTAPEALLKHRRLLPSSAPLAPVSDSVNLSAAPGASLQAGSLATWKLLSAEPLLQVFSIRLKEVLSSLSLRFILKP